MLDEVRIAESIIEAPDETMALLADMTSASDERLRALAQRIAGQLFLDVARHGPVRVTGIGSPRSLPFSPDGGDLDLDAGIDVIARSLATRTAFDPDELRVRGWTRPATAYCLVLDRSGSMGGAPLATSAVATAAIAARRPGDYSAIVFANDVVVVKSQDADRPVGEVVRDVLALRGFGTTDLAGALRVAQLQLRRARARRRITVLMSDCRSTVDGDVNAAAADLDELVILAPADDHDEAAMLATSLGVRMTQVSGPSDVAGAMRRLLDDH